MLALAAGVSALGIAFGAWALAAVAVLAVVLGGDLRAGRQRARAALVLIACAAAALALAALPTWAELSAALRVASTIASTGNSGNLHTPLRLEQVLGIWINGSYKLAPAGADLVATHALIALALVLVVLGAVQLARLRARALAAWFALTLLASLVISQSVSTWADAKTLVLSSPAVVLLAWAGIAGLRTLPRPRLWGPVAALLSLALAAAILYSDALQYHSSDLAPTARYEQLASLDARFAGRGPTLFTDFDEYSMYELRDLDVGGPDFVYPPPTLASAAGGYGDPVDLNRVAPRALLAYPLIVTRRDPSATRPPAAYRLLSQDSYYQVWGRRQGAPAAVAHVALSGSPALQCARISGLAQRARAGAGERLIAAEAPELVRIQLARASHPRRWGRERKGLVMSTPGRLSASFTLPSSGAWDVWVQGQIMPTVTLSVDGVRVAAIAGQLDGNSLVPNTVPPLRVRLAAGQHRLWVTRGGFTLAPGDAGQAVLDAVFLTPAAAPSQGTLRIAAPARWQSLCGRSYQWAELVPGG